MLEFTFYWSHVLTIGRLCGRQLEGSPGWTSTDLFNGLHIEWLQFDTQINGSGLFGVSIFNFCIVFLYLYYFMQFMCEGYDLLQHLMLYYVFYKPKFDTWLAQIFSFFFGYYFSLFLVLNLWLCIFAMLHIEIRCRFDINKFYFFFMVQMHARGPLSLISLIIFQNFKSFTIIKQHSE